MLLLVLFLFVVSCLIYLFVVLELVRTECEDEYQNTYDNEQKNEYENVYEHIIFSYLLVRVTLEIIIDSENAYPPTLEPA